MSKSEEKKPARRKSGDGSRLIKLPHGGYVKKSTYEWMKKKDAQTNEYIMWFFGLMILCAILQQCSG